MNFPKYLNQVEKEANEKMYERLTKVLIEREESVVAIDNELNLLKFNHKEVTLESLERLKNEVDKIDDAICEELKEMVGTLMNDITIGLKNCRIYLVTKKDNLLYRNRGKIIANKVQNKIQELVDETEDFTKYLYEIIEELKSALNSTKEDIDPSIEVIFEKCNNKYLKLHNRISIERFLNDNGFIFDRNGNNHDIFKNNLGYCIPVPRHNYEKSGLYIQKEVNEINNKLNRGIS